MREDKVGGEVGVKTKEAPALTPALIHGVEVASLGLACDGCHGGKHLLHRHGVVGAVV